MSFPYTPVPSNNPATVTLPSDGDLASALSVDSPFGDLADKVAHAQWPESDNTKKYPLASRGLSRIQRCVCSTSQTAGVNDWAPQNGFNCSIMAQVTLAGTAVIYQPLDLPDGSVLTSVIVYLIATGGHGGLPGTMPTARLFKMNATTGVLTQVGITTGDPSNLAAYEAYHFISIGGGINETIDNTQYKYVVAVTGEAGGGSIAGLQYWACQTASTVTSQDPGAS